MKFDPGWQSRGSTTERASIVFHYDLAFFVLSRRSRNVTMVKRQKCDFIRKTSECPRSFYSPPAISSRPRSRIGAKSPRYGVSPAEPPNGSPDRRARTTFRRRRPETNGDHASPSVTAVPVYRGVTGARVRSIHQTDRSVNTYRVTDGRVMRNARAEHRSVVPLIPSLIARVLCATETFGFTVGRATRYGVWRIFYVYIGRIFTPVFFYSSRRTVQLRYGRLLFLPRVIKRYRMQSSTCFFYNRPPARVE